jgi:hypothetical protein
MIEAQFTAVMNAAEKNGYSVEEMNEMFVRQIVEEMAEENRREQRWQSFREEFVQNCKAYNLADEQIESQMLVLHQRYLGVMQEAGASGWTDEQITKALDDRIFNAPLGASIEIQKPGTPAQAVIDEDDDFELTPIGGGVSFHELTEDSAPVPDEMIANRHQGTDQFDSPSP